MTRSHCIVFAAVIAALAELAGCHASRPDAFPTRGELDRIASAPPPARVFDDRSVDADAWELRGPLPDAFEVTPANDASPWAQDLAGAATSRPGLVTTSAAIACAAREAAAFVAEKKALPAEPLRAYIAARCGVPVTGLALSSQSGEVPEDVAEADLHGRWAAQVQGMVREGVAAGSRFAGIGFARQGRQVAVVLATAPRPAHLERTPFVPAEGKVVLRGEVLTPTASIEALVNRGPFGYAECAVNVTVALPRFAIECPVAADDPSAWIQVVAFPPGRVLGDTVVEALVFPSGKPDKTYARARRAASAPLDRAVMTRALVERLNAVRSEAGLGPVRVSAAESRRAELLAPHYFAAVAGEGDVTVADRIALGLQAGWDVEGVVRHGHFTAGAGEAGNPADLLDLALARPFGRRALLDPDVQAVALGTVVPGGRTLGAVFGTYAILDPAKTPREAAATLGRLVELRRAKRLAAPTAVPELAGVMAKAVDRVEKGQAPADAMQWLLDASAEQLRGRTLHASVLTAPSVDRIQFPAALLADPSVDLAVGVGRYRAEGEPWAQLVVFFVTISEPAATRTALAPGGSRG